VRKYGGENKPHEKGAHTAGKKQERLRPHCSIRFQWGGRNANTAA
jgi:hypothetical protein